jgi:hypothetical protein
VEGEQQQETGQFGEEEVSAERRWMKERLRRLVAQEAWADGQSIDQSCRLGKGREVDGIPLLLPVQLGVVRSVAAGSCLWAEEHLGRV